MDIFAIVALVVVVILIVGYPLANPAKYQEYGGKQNGSPEQNELYGAREIAFEALRDLQFEFATGKLSASDYEQLKGRYELQAAEIMQQLDQLKPRKNKSGESARACPRCHSVMSAQDKFCAKCGAKL